MRWKCYPCRPCRSVAPPGHLQFTTVQPGLQPTMPINPPWNSRRNPKTTCGSTVNGSPRLSKPCWSSSQSWPDNQLKSANDIRNSSLNLAAGLRLSFHGFQRLGRRKVWHSAQMYFTGGSCDLWTNRMCQRAMPCIRLRSRLRGSIFVWFLLVCGYCKRTSNHD